MSRLLGGRQLAVAAAGGPGSLRGILIGRFLGAQAEGV